MNLNKKETLNKLTRLFPGIDKGWLSLLLLKYTTSHDAVEQVSEKILEHYHGWYPKTDLNPNSVVARNKYLFILSEIFPLADVGFLRSCIVKLKSNHVYKIIERLLEMSKKSDGYPQRLEPGPLSKSDYFKSKEYIAGCRAKLLNDFPDHWESTVNAVMAETNDSYTEAYEKLIDIPANSWISSLFSFVKRKPILVPELQNRDLLEDIRSRKEKLHLAEDAQLAQSLNLADYQRYNQLIECQCCYGDYVFEDLGSCSNGHLFCKDCVNRFVNESLFGQGTMRGQKVMCVHTDGCSGEFSLETMQRMVPQTLLESYNASLSECELLKAGIKLAHCPFCPYAEEEIKITFDWFRILKRHIFTHFTIDRIRKSSPLISFVFSIFLAIFLSPHALLLPLLLNLYMKRLIESDSFISVYRKLHASMKERIPILNCKKCGKPSCTKCKAEWQVDHICYENEQNNFRLYVERAMSNAMIRVCPNCQISFSKSDGCNKLTCPNW
jgi:hypothetical protein